MIYGGNIYFCNVEENDFYTEVYAAYAITSSNYARIQNELKGLINPSAGHIRSLLSEYEYSGNLDSRDIAAILGQGFGGDNILGGTLSEGNGETPANFGSTRTDNQSSPHGGEESGIRGLDRNTGRFRKEGEQSTNSSSPAAVESAATEAAKKLNTPVEVLHNTEEELSVYLHDENGNLDYGRAEELIGRAEEGLISLKRFPEEIERERKALQFACALSKERARQMMIQRYGEPIGRLE